MRAIRIRWQIWLWARTPSAPCPRAITVANANTGADTITLADGTFDIDQTANGGSFKITDPLTLIGSGQSASKILAVSNTVDDSGVDGALFAAVSTTLNIQHLTLDGGSGSGILAAGGFRYVDSSGTITDVAVNNVSYFEGDSGGNGIVAIGPTDNVAISGSSFTRTTAAAKSATKTAPPAASRAAPTTA